MPCRSLRFTRLSTLAATALMSLAAPSHGWAQEGRQPSASQADERARPFTQWSFEELRAEFAKDPNRWSREACSFGVPIMAALEIADPQEMQIRVTSRVAQAICAAQEGRFEDAEARIRELRELKPDTVYVPLSLFIAGRGNRAQFALDVFGWIEGEIFRSLEPQTFGPANLAISKAGRKDEFDDLALKWLDAGAFEKMDRFVAASLSRNILAVAARTGRGDAAERALEKVTDPTLFIEFLTQRQYEPFWPTIEQRAGQSLEKVGAEHVEVSLAAMRAAPDDRDDFSEAVRALHYNGQFEEAIALAATWDPEGEAERPVRQGDAWALNLQALAFDALGETQKADAIFDRLAGLDPVENPWAVSFIINRASRLVGYGRFEAGLEAAKQARAAGGSPFAEMIIAKDHACALAALGRTKEASKELDFLRANRTSGSIGLAATGLVCSGLRKEAAQVLIEGLRDPVTRNSTANDLLSAESGLFYTQSMLPNLTRLMQEFPELKSEFDKHARLLPMGMIPRAATLRARLDLPKWQDR